MIQARTASASSAALVHEVFLARSAICAPSAAITAMPGAMTGGGYPDGIRQIVDPYLAGRREEAMAAYARWLPLINYENRQCGLQAAKILMKEGGVIGSDAVRHPLQSVRPEARAGLIEIARQLDPVALRWGR